jgi:hypothetical protein
MTTHSLRVHNIGLHMATIAIDTPGPTDGSVHVHVHLSTTLAISPVQARRIANRVVLDQMSTGLGALDPELMLTTDKLLWRVPIQLSLPYLGDIGVIGSIQVDADHGEILTQAGDLEKMMRLARMLHAGATLSAKQ